MGPRCWVFSSPFLAEGAVGVAGGEGVVVLLWCFVLLGWWGLPVDVDDAPGDFDAVGVMVCGVAVSTLGWGPGGWRWWRLFASRAGVLGVAVDGGALGVTLCRGRGGGDRGVVGDGTAARRWWGWRWCGYCRGCWRRWCCRRLGCHGGGWRVSWWSGGVGVVGVGAGWPACWCSVVPGVPLVAGVWLACGPGGVGCLWCWDISFGCSSVCSDRCCFGCGLGCQCCG